MLRLSNVPEYKNAFFEPIAFPTSEIYNDNPFVKEILRTGKELAYIVETITGDRKTVYSLIELYKEKRVDRRC